MVMCITTIESSDSRHLKELNPVNPEMEKVCAKKCGCGVQTDNNNVKIGADYWQNCYTKQYMRWHINEVHELLVKYIHLLELQKPASIFVPFCGKSVDIQWLYSRGHNVLAVDIIEEPILEQFRLLNVSYNVTEESDDLTVYESSDKRVKILKCDFLTFDCSKYVNTVDAVWDRAAIIALNAEDQRKYATVMKKFLKPKFSYLIQTLTFNESEMNGPPFCVTRERLEECFGDIANIKQFENDSQKTMNFGIEASFHAFHLTNK